MIKTILMTAAAVFVFASTGIANAQENWRGGLYMKAGAGWNRTDDKDADSTLGALEIGVDNNGYSFGAAAGMAYNDFLRAEVEITRRVNDIDGDSVAGVVTDIGGDLTSTAIMANGYIDLPTGTVIRPYVGAGIGVAAVKAEADIGGLGSFDGSDTVFAYQAMAGADYAVNDTWGVYAEYKYFATADVKLDEPAITSDLDYDNHSIMAGFRYNFE